MHDERTAQAEVRQDRPRVVMLLANEFLHDTRVHKEAQSLIQCGCEVHLVAIARPDLPDEAEQDGMLVHRVSSRGSLLRLALAIALCWSRPLLRRILPVSVRSGRPTGASAAAVSAAPSRTQRTGRRGTGVTRMLAPSMKSLRRVLIFLFGSPAVMGVARRGNRVLWLAVHPAHVRREFARLVRRGVLVSGLKRRFPTSLRLLAFNAQCVARARALEPDVIHCHDLNTLLAGALLKRIQRIPLVYDSHELFLERNIGERSRGLDHVVWAPVERCCIHRCDAIVSVAEGICRHLERQYGVPRPHLIRNVQPYEPPAPRSRLLSAELGIAPDKAVVLYPGAITINRGLEILIDSACHLQDAVYVIMGYARSAAYLQSLQDRAIAQGQLNRTVFFRDAVPIDEVVTYAASADLGIVPTQNVCLSYYFESSNKIFHCVMAGVPVAMSDHAEKRLLVEEHGIGVLFDETNAEGIARTVNEALADRDAYAEMRRRCLEAARTLNWEHEEQKLRSIYAGLLGSRVAHVNASARPVMIEISGEVQEGSTCGNAVVPVR